MASGDSKVFTGKDGALWLQRSPGHTPEYLGCFELDDISADNGDLSLIQCFDVNGRHQTLGQIEGEPSPITTSLTTYLSKTAQFMERLSCPFWLHVNLRCGGRADIFDNWERAVILDVAKITNRTLKGLLARTAPAAAEQTFDISALPPFIDIYEVQARRQGISETRAINDIFFLDNESCPSDCVIAYNLGDLGIVGTDGAVGNSANIYITDDGGVTWALAAADPFAAQQNVSSVTGFFIDKNTIRWIVARGTTDAGNPAEIAYSDDDGATWTNVDVGSTNAQFTPNKKGIYVADQFNIWVVTSGGYIYKSEDSGLTWDAQHQGTLTAQNLHIIRFAPGSTKYGWAAGASNAILSTIDGENWSLISGPSAEAGNTVHALDVRDSKHVYVGYSTGRVYYTSDAGENWTEIFDISGDVTDIQFVNDLVGFMTHNDSNPVGTVYFTRNGGKTWKALTTPTNTGLNAVSALLTNLAYVGGEVQSSTPVILKVS